MAKRKTKETNDLPPELRDDYQPLPGENTAGRDVGEVPPHSEITAQQVVQNVAVATGTPEEGDERGPGSRAKQPQRGGRLRTTLDIPAGDACVQMVDDFRDVGIKVQFPNDATDRPTPEEKDIIRKHVKAEAGGRPSGFGWKSQRGLWQKPIQGRDETEVNPKKAVAIRLDTERRTADLAVDLQDHHDLKTGHADRVAKRRAEREQSEHIPD